MLNNLKGRLIEFIKVNKLIDYGDGIVVGLSGGPDSICLLYLLNSIRDEFKIDIVAVHINHMLRAEEADADELYCKDVCEQLGIEFFSRKININEYSMKNGISSETAGREVRYRYFDEVMKSKGFNKIATAHNANDQAETILMRLMRGTGIEGLCGIPVKRDNVYIRPILFMKREEVEEYCRVNNLMPRIDKSNLERVYSRNKVRLDILPYMKENFNSDVIEAINRMSELLRIDNNFIDNEVNKYYEEFCTRENNIIVISKEVFKFHKAILYRVIRRAIKDVAGNNYNVELKNIEDVITLSEIGTGKIIYLPNDIIAVNVYGDIKIKINGYEIKKEDSEKIILKEEVVHKVIEFNDYIFEFELIENIEKNYYNKNSSTKYFDFDKINGNIVIRYRKNGDKIIPLGLRGTKKVKDVLINLKIPKEKRDFIPIIQFGEDIGWIIDVAISEKFKVTKETNKILKIHSKRKEL